LTLLAKTMSVRVLRVMVIRPFGVSAWSVVWVTRPVADVPDSDDSCPLALSPSRMALLEMPSQGGGFWLHHL
jgi:hypothetical protein